MKEPFTPQQIEMLLGGYATGTLTPEENQALMAAALHDQRLFDALMDEEALRDALSDAGTRAELLAALRPPERARAWWRAPWPWAAAATAAVALLALILVRRPPAAPPTEIAQNAPIAAEAIRQQARPEPESAPVSPPGTLAAPASKGVAPRRRADERDEAAGNAIESAKEKKSDRPLGSGSPGGVIGGIIAPTTRRDLDRAAAAPPPPPPPPATAAPTVAELQQQVQVQAGRQAFAEPASGPRQVQAPTATTQSVTVQASSDSIRLAKAEAAREPLEVALAFLQPDGTWHEVAHDAAMPAGRGLRLTVTSQRGGMLSLVPALAPPHQILAGTPLQVYLPPRAAGEVPVRLQVGPMPAAEAPAAPKAAETRSSSGFRGIFGRSKRMAPPPPPPPAAAPALPLQREIVLKIVENR